jgi:hypothetical protein
MRKLEEDYEVIVEKMNSFTEGEIHGSFIGEVGTFLDKFGNSKERVILSDEDGNQIFKMKDGNYILETEDYDDFTVSYFISSDLNELIMHVKNC